MEGCKQEGEWDESAGGATVGSKKMMWLSSMRRMALCRRRYLQHNNASKLLDISDKVHHQHQQHNRRHHEAHIGTRFFASALRANSCFGSEKKSPTQGSFNSS